MKTIKEPKQRNYVAKYASSVNKCSVFRDRTKYTRNLKHKAKINDY